MDSFLKLRSLAPALPIEKPIQANMYNRVNVKKGNVKGKLSRAVAEKLLAGQRHACYVLITCGNPSSRGEMEVEMTYEGDGDLAAYLIDSAQLFLNGPPAIAEYPG